MKKPVLINSLEVTITNHGGHDTHDGHTYYHGVPSEYYPFATPGAKYRITIEYIGSDENHKPELHAFMPHSQFGGWIDTLKLSEKIAECRREIRQKNNDPFPGWWEFRLEKLILDKSNHAAAIKNHKAAIQSWKKNLPKQQACLTS